MRTQRQIRLLLAVPNKVLLPLAKCKTHCFPVMPPVPEDPSWEMNYITQSVYYSTAPAKQTNRALCEPERRCNHGSVTSFYSKRRKKGGLAVYRVHPDLCGTKVLPVLRRLPNAACTACSVLRLKQTSCHIYRFSSGACDTSQVQLMVLMGKRRRGARVHHPHCSGCI